MKTFEEDASFEAWWKECLEDEMFYDTEKPAAREAWEAATLAERERCARVVDETATGPLEYDLPAYVLQELANAIRNP